MVVRVFVDFHRWFQQKDIGLLLKGEGWDLDALNSVPMNEDQTLRTHRGSEYFFCDEWDEASLNSKKHSLVKWDNGKETWL